VAKDVALSNKVLLKIAPPSQTPLLEFDGVILRRESVGSISIVGGVHVVVERAKLGESTVIVFVYGDVQRPWLFISAAG